MTLDRPLKLGTRRSLMAMTQSKLVADELTARTGHEVELVGVTTQGDVSKAQLAQIGGTGVFVSALRDKILSGEVDFAVHSLKDLPTLPAEGIALAAVPPRDDPRDALCGELKLADLPSGARDRHGLAAADGAAARAPARPGRRADPRQRRHAAAEGHRRRARRGRARATPVCGESRGSKRFRRSSTRVRCCPRRARAPSPWNAAPTAPT